MKKSKRQLAAGSENDVSDNGASKKVQTGAHTSAKAEKKDLEEDEQFSQLVQKLIDSKSFTELVNKTQKFYSSRYKEYKKLKFKSTIYQVGDILQISNAEDPENDFIGKLLRIIRIEHEKVLTLIEIQWYYKKSDIPKGGKYNEINETISENELFLTDHKDYTFVDCINGKCQIYTYEEFDKLSQIQPFTFFTRAGYDTKKRKFNPPYEQWKVGCLCKRPLNPDLLYIQCDICQKWLHLECAHVTEQELEKIDNYQCVECLKAKGSQAKQVSIEEEKSEDKQPPAQSTEIQEPVQEQPTKDVKPESVQEM